MASNYKIFFISIYLASASVIAQHFSVGEMYYYRIPDSKLYRAQMNVTNEWLSAEIIKDDKRKIVFFKHGDPSDLYIELSKKKAKKVENYVYDGRLLMWSSDSSKPRGICFHLYITMQRRTCTNLCLVFLMMILKSYIFMIYRLVVWLQNEWLIILA